jgi:transforming growth factor-beta-induced protein
VQTRDRWRKSPWLVVLLFGLLAGGCLAWTNRQTSDDVTAVAEVPVATTIAAPIEVAPPAAAETVADIIGTSPEFSTLARLLSEAGLSAPLGGPGTITVFAPNNAAFEALGPDQLAALEATPSLLQRVLLTHVVGTEVLMSSQINDGQSVVSASQETLTFAVTASGTSVNGANILDADRIASNGVVHSIDQVLLPTPPATPDTTVAPAAETTVADVIGSSSDLSTLSQLLGEVGLSTVLAGDGPFTVFAPNNDAFAKIPAADLAALRADPVKLKDVLLGHVVNGTSLASVVAATPSFDSAAGTKLVVTADGDTVLVGGSAVLTPDLEAGNGVVHVIDTVILAPAAPTTVPPTTVPPTTVPTTTVPPAAVLEDFKVFFDSNSAALDLIDVTTIAQAVEVIKTLPAGFHGQRGGSRRHQRQRSSQRRAVVASSRCGGR